MIDEILKYNKEFGYYREVTNSYKDLVPDYYTRNRNHHLYGYKTDRTFAGSPWDQEWRCEDH